MLAALSCSRSLSPALAAVLDLGPLLLYPGVLKKQPGEITGTRAETAEKEGASVWKRNMPEDLAGCWPGPGDAERFGSKRTAPGPSCRERDSWELYPGLRTPRVMLPPNFLAASAGSPPGSNRPEEAGVGGTRGHFLPILSATALPAWRQLEWL